jgi:hypothetical protein
MAPQMERQRIPEPAADGDILREQLEYLIAHAAGTERCGCAECQRYLRVRSVLLEIFAAPPRASVREIAPRLAIAA